MVSTNGWQYTVSEYGYHNARSTGPWEDSVTVRAPAPGLLPAGSHCAGRRFYPSGNLSEGCSMSRCWDLEPLRCCCCRTPTDPEPHQLALVCPREAKEHCHLTEVAWLSRKLIAWRGGVMNYFLKTGLISNIHPERYWGKKRLKTRTSFKNLLVLIVSL